MRLFLLSCTRNHRDIILNATSHSLRVQNLTNIHCNWTINIVNSSSSKTYPIYFRVNALSLDPKDNFSIHTTNGQIVYEKNGPLEYTVIFTGVISGNLSVTLVTSNNSYQRIFEVEYSYKEPNVVIPITVANERGLFSLPKYNATGFHNITTIDKFSIIFQLQPPLSFTHKLVVGFMDVTVKKEINIEGAEGNFSKYNVEVPDLIAMENKIKITLNKYELQNRDSGEVHLYYEVYNKNCTEFIGDLKLEETTHFSSLSLPSVRCLKIIESQAGTQGFQFDFGNFLFQNDMDSLTIRNGNRRNASVVVVVNKQNKGSVQNSYHDTISMGPHLYLTYESPFTSAASAKQSVLQITSFSYGGYYTEPKPIALISTSKPNIIPIVFILNSENNNKAFLQTDGKQKLKVGSLKVFNTDKIAGQEPLAMFNKDDLIPEILASSSNILRLEISNNTLFSGNLNETKSDLNKIAKANTASFAVDGTLNCGATSSWLIPQYTGTLANQTIFGLQISYMILNSSNDMITLTRYDKDKEDILSIHGKDAANSKSQSFPDFLLFANSSYLLTYSRSKSSCTQTSNIVLLQASYLLNHISDYENWVSLSVQQETVVTPDTYPNYYSLRSPLLNKYCVVDNRGCGWLFNSTSELKYFVTFKDLDLAVSHSLKIVSGQIAGGQEELRAKQALPNDNLYKNGLYLKLNVPFNKSYSIVDEMSGRGFEANIEAIDCGDFIDGSKNNSLTTPGYPKPIQFKKCIWIIDSKNVPGVHGSVLNFTYTLGDGKNKGNLTIFDTATLRDRRYVKINASLKYNAASVNRTIIVYKNVGKENLMAGINITWKLDPCKHGYCKNSNGVRCILDTWLCDGESECGDFSDEVNCNNTFCPKPAPAPSPKTGKSSGVSGWVIVLVIIPLAMVVGAIIAKFGPSAVRRLRGSSYQEFRDFSEVS
ncbi:cubilin-like protein [Dinothrombium tinctorium]|uniref:Cubilin-like protein n=1 Tax=Dinothrombium tinctorium TaxID=1965070 RepID=A0A443R7Z3_9ACAR|nr:cubilin-like protein [Dinothrombium tinctorium]